MNNLKGGLQHKTIYILDHTTVGFVTH